ncbi:hypothetical protein GQ53DRAFT_743897 [Thozetella sp. PMI_491]|nr:hypothetical protein GQ53DRAFT_743897 [Thozetella sp. PMI_491]
MVGVPGRSKGCNTCIQRKIKCDQERPLCGNCRKSNRLCTGYRRKVAYVFSNDVTFPVGAENASDEGTVVHQGRWRQHKSQQRPGVVGRPSASSIGMHVSTATAVRQQYHYLFLNDQLPAALLESKRPKSAVNANFLLQLQDMAIQTPVLESALSAFFSSRIAWKQGDKGLMFESRKIYARGLQLLRTAIHDPQTRVLDETIAACMLLLYYELLGAPGSGPRSFGIHKRGAMALLLQRGPEACTSPLGLSIFISLRAQAVYAGLINRHDTIFSRPEWMEKPWTLIPKKETDEINDLLVTLPAIYEQFDELAAETNPKVLRDSLYAVISKCITVKAGLDEIYEKFCAKSPGPLYWPELSGVKSRDDDVDLGSVFPVSFHFPSFMVAEVLTLYWSSLIAVHYQLMYAFANLTTLESSPALPEESRGLMRPSSPPSPGLRSAVYFDVQSGEHRDQWVTAVRNICQSAEFLIQKDMGHMSMATILILLRSSKTCMEESFPDDYHREIEWCGDFVDRLQKEFIVPVGEFMDNE